MADVPPSKNSGPDPLAAAAPPGDLLSLRQLAAALAVDPGQLSKESRRPGFPARVGGLYSLGHVRQWRAGNVRQKKISPPTPPAQVREKKFEGVKGVKGMKGGAGQGRLRDATASAAPAPPPAFFPPPSSLGEPLNAEGLAAVDVMTSAKSSALEKTEAAVALVAAQVAADAKGGRLTPNRLESFKKLLQELRQSTADYRIEAIAKREWIAISDVKAIVGELCARLVQVCSMLENSIATELAIWISDPKVQSLSADDRKLKVREFVAKTCNEIRTLTADEIEKLIAKASDQEV
jgi:hypothetical protein